MLQIEHKLNITITLPQICHFCGEEISKKYGQDSDSLCFHSLDGNHNNWIPENKVSAHMGCHNSYHMSGERHPMYGKFGEEHQNYGYRHTDETKQKMSKAILGDKNPMKRPEVKIIHIESMKRSWQDRRERYGPSGRRSGSKTADLEKVWSTRRERYGSMGVKDPESYRHIASERAKRSWQTRRERYGPTGVRDPEAWRKAISEGKAKKMA